MFHSERRSSLPRKLSALVGALVRLNAGAPPRSGPRVRVGVLLDVRPLQPDGNWLDGGDHVLQVDLLDLLRLE